MTDSRQEADSLLKTLDAVVCDAYHIEPSAFPPNEYGAMEEAFLAHSEKGNIARLVLSFAVGCVFGRWDIRFATGTRQAEHLETFEALPSASPASLQLTEEQLNDYPLGIESNGVLLDDLEHQGDIVRRVRDALEVIWDERADAVEREACEILKVQGTCGTTSASWAREGFGTTTFPATPRAVEKRRSTGCSSLRRRITASGSTTTGLTKICSSRSLVNYVEPKIRLEVDAPRNASQPESRSGRHWQRSQTARQGEWNVQEEFLSELQDFEDKLRRAANMHLVPRPQRWGRSEHRSAS